MILMQQSLMKKFNVKTGSTFQPVTVTAIRMTNDINGNPRYKVQVWTDFNGTIWSPKVHGFRRSKDDTYVLKSVYNLEEEISNFMSVFEVSINE